MAPEEELSTVDDQSLIDRECDFCHRLVDEDEELEPVFIGEPPKPSTRSERVFSDKNRRTAGFSGRDGDFHVLGEPIDVVSSLLKAVKRSDYLSYDVKRRVLSVQAVGLEEPQSFVKKPDSRSVGLGEEHTFTMEEDDSSIGLTLEIDPPTESREPDLCVCPYCKESFESSPR